MAASPARAGVGASVKSGSTRAAARTRVVGRLAIIVAWNRGYTDEALDCRCRIDPVGRSSHGAAAPGWARPLRGDAGADIKGLSDQQIADLKAGAAWAMLFRWRMAGEPTNARKFEKRDKDL